MDFGEFLKSGRVILFDGAMGTELAKHGLEMSGTNNLANPEQVLEIHRSYLKAGAEVLLTNTLTMNRLNAQREKPDIEIKEVNLAGAALARQAVSGSRRYVCGDIGSTGQLLEPYGGYTEEEFFRVFKEQAVYLAAGGVDGFIVETMIDLQEALCALRACKEAATLPVIVTMSFSQLSQGGRTVMGNSVEQVAKTLAGAGADAVGANCGDLDPFEMAAIAKLFTEATALPVMIQPNAGKPKMEGDRTVFDMEPEQFAEGLCKCVAAGASLVGGCCGTGPAHILAAKGLLKRSSE